MAPAGKWTPGRRGGIPRIVTNPWAVASFAPTNRFLTFACFWKTMRNKITTTTAPPSLGGGPRRTISGRGDARIRKQLADQLLTSQWPGACKRNFGGRLGSMKPLPLCTGERSPWGREPPFFGEQGFPMGWGIPFSESRDSPWGGESLFWRAWIPHGVGNPFWGEGDSPWGVESLFRRAGIPQMAGNPFLESRDSPWGGESLFRRAGIPHGVGNPFLESRNFPWGGESLFRDGWITHGAGNTFLDMRDSP